MDDAAEWAHGAIMNNHGQNCCAGSRTFVQEDIYDAFVAKAKELAEKRVVGCPWTEGTQHGPQVSIQALCLFIAYNICCHGVYQCRWMRHSSRRSWAT